MPSTKVLVAYSEPTDLAAQFAMAVAEQLSRHGLRIELRPVRRAGPASSYAGVILGGARDDGGWDAAAVDYLAAVRLRDGFQPAPVWPFHSIAARHVEAQEGWSPEVPEVVLRLAAGVGSSCAAFVLDPLAGRAEPFPHLSVADGGEAHRWADALADELGAPRLARRRLLALAG